MTMARRRASPLASSLDEDGRAPAAAGAGRPGPGDRRSSGRPAPIGLSPADDPRRGGRRPRAPSRRKRDLGQAGPGHRGRQRVGVGEAVERGRQVAVRRAVAEGRGGQRREPRGSSRGRPAPRPAAAARTARGRRPGHPAGRPGRARGSRPRSRPGCAGRRRSWPRRSVRRRTAGRGRCRRRTRAGRGRPHGPGVLGDHRRREVEPDHPSERARPVRPGPTLSLPVPQATSRAASPGPEARRGDRRPPPAAVAAGRHDRVEPVVDRGDLVEHRRDLGLWHRVARAGGGRPDCVMMSRPSRRPEGGRR